MLYLPDTAPTTSPTTMVTPTPSSWDELAGIRVWCSHLPRHDWPAWMRPRNPSGLLLSALHDEVRFVRMFVDGKLGGFLDPDVPAEMALLRLLATFVQAQMPMLYRWVRMSDTSYANWRTAVQEGRDRLAYLTLRAWQEEASPRVERWVPAAKERVAMLQLDKERPLRLVS
jgi:hypothetical protein